MKISGSPVHIAAQLYASSSAQAKEAAALQATRRQAAKFEVKDDVAVRADRVEDQTPGRRSASSDTSTADRGEGVGRREAPVEKPAVKRPGSLVDLTA